MKKALTKTLMLATIILMDILTGMEFDLFVPSFPELQSHFNLTPFWVESLLSVNFIGYCFSLFFVGTWADRYGRKPIILLGLGIFILGSLFCLNAPSHPFMLIGRFLQGIGIAAPAILSFLIIADSYSLKKQQSLFTILNGLFNLSAGTAPVLGSYITLYFHWQGNFMTLLLLGILSFLMTLFFIPKQTRKDIKETRLLIGYNHLFQSKPLMLLIMLFVINFVPYWVFVGMSPILYMENLGVSLSHFGYYQGAMAFVFAVGSLAFSFIITRFEKKKLLMVSSQIFIFSLISLALVTAGDSPSPLVITLAFLPFIIGQIIPSAILFPVCLNMIPDAKGRVGALLQGGRLIFSSICLQLAGYYYQGTFQNIGAIICLFILITILSLHFVRKNQLIMKDQT